MTTKLGSPVLRDLGISIQGRPVIVGLETKNGKPVLSVRLKGFRSGWYADLEQVAWFCVTRYPRTNVDQQLSVKNDPDVIAKWRDENESGESNPVRKRKTEALPEE